MTTKIQLVNNRLRSEIWYKIGDQEEWSTMFYRQCKEPSALWRVVTKIVDHIIREWNIIGLYSNGDVLPYGDKFQIFIGSRTLEYERPSEEEMTEDRVQEYVNNILSDLSEELNKRGGQLTTQFVVSIRKPLKYRLLNWLANILP